MNKKKSSPVVRTAAVSFRFDFFPGTKTQPSTFGATLSLREGWTLQSSGKVDEKGEILSSPAFQPKDWYTVTVPTTVVAALVEHKVYPDPFFGMNLRSFPASPIPSARTFPISRCSRTVRSSCPGGIARNLSLPASYKGKTIWLNFGGINYRANIWLNGKQIAKSDDVAGAWRTYEFNITDAAMPGKTNVLAVQVFSPTETDLAITFVDWNPAPPDKNMGLFREVDITTSGPVALRYPAVVSKVDSPANDKAHLTVTALLKNAANHPVKGTLKGRIEKIEFSQEVELGAGESKDVTFDSRTIFPTQCRPPASVVAGADGQAGALQPQPGIRCRRQDFRPGGDAVRHSRDQV